MTCYSSIPYLSQPFFSSLFPPSILIPVSKSWMQLTHVPADDKVDTTKGAETPSPTPDSPPELVQSNLAISVTGHHTGTPTPLVTPYLKESFPESGNRPAVDAVNEVGRKDHLDMNTSVKLDASIINTVFKSSSQIGIGRPSHLTGLSPEFS